MTTEISYGLGLDQGVGSIGWALLILDASGKPIGIERLGTHCFEAGTEGDIEGGRDESRAGPRRMARQLRKQYRRRVLRKRRLLRWLQELGLMPAGDISTAEGRDALLKGLDEQLRRKWEADGTDHRTRQLLPYRLRAAGLSGPLEPFELGRALYHLAQRRGYLSNRKAQSASADPTDAKPSKKAKQGEAPSDTAPPTPEGKEDAGVVRAAIIELERQMRGAGCKTLAEYFSKLDPAGTLGDRLRGRWTAREMFLEEFNRLWDEQAKHHPILNAKAAPRLHYQIKHPSGIELQRRKKAGRTKPKPSGNMEQRTNRDEVYDAIFNQRPLQSMNHLIGTCDLVPDAKRCPLGHRMAQRFRLLQRVNDLEIRLPDFTRRPLTADERSRLLEALDTQASIAFSQLKTKKWFGLPTGSTFNLEEGGEKKLIGNRTQAKCRAIFGDDRWDALTDSEKDAVVQDLILFEKPAALANRGKKVWKLTDEQAIAFGDCVLEPGFAAHSKGALARLLPRMEEGCPYATARKEEFNKSDGDTQVHDLLPPVEGPNALGQLRNPTVTRALTELRKLVNAIVRKYGKPRWIRLELARDLKRARKQRERLAKDMRAREKLRDDARSEVEALPDISRASRADIERVLLAKECGWICPYTGKAFGMNELVGRHPQVDVEHIWPLSRSLDDSFLNKTLCFASENRTKNNRTPFEAYARDSERWESIVDRVKRFKCDDTTRRIKLERFLAEELPDGFAERHLAETRKIGAASAEYLGLLYGGPAPIGKPQRVFVSAGGLTAHLRREWHLSGILFETGEKSRDDHRHHAIDALVIALTDPRAVQLLQKAAEQASAVGRRLFAPVDEPWPDFVNEVRTKVEAINVSFRQSRRIAGKLHAETNYSKPISLRTPATGDQPAPGAKKSRKLSADRPAQPTERRIRKVLAKLTEKEIPRIVDPKIRKAVEDQIKKHGLVPKGPAKQYTDFTDPALHPFTLTRAGQKNWIHKVRLSTGEKPWPVGTGPRERHVSSTAGSNHHTVLSKGPDGKWFDTPVSLIDARRSSISKRPHSGDSLSLSAGEFVLLGNEMQQSQLFRVLSVSAGDIELVLHTDARPSTARKQDRVRGGASALLKRGLKKVAVTYLGEIRRAGG